jgi:Rha family phage regulatory protein
MNREQQTFTMSSREIAHLCEKRHDNVLRNIEKMIQDIGDLRFEAVNFEKQYQDVKGEWRKEYRLPKDLTVTLITGYGFVSPLVLGSDQFFQPINKGTGFRSKLHESTIQGI